MSYRHIASAADAAPLRDELEHATRIALDCEAAGFHRYSDRLCLLQLTTERETYLIDPFGFDPTDLIKEALESPRVEVVMHGADFDLRLLKRDLGITLAGLFDTQIAAQLLGEEALGLQALLESKLGVRLSKKHQRADWARRPLSDDMLEYAANDTRHLMPLADVLVGELAEAGRTAWAEEECRALEESATATLTEPDEPEDPVVRVKGARKLSTRQVAALREALRWRDRIARSKDRAPFRVVSDGPLVEAVASGPRRVSDLVGIKGFSGRLAKEEGPDLIQRLEAVRRADEADLEPYPNVPARGPGRPPPDVEALVDKLKDIRNRRADEVGLPRGTLLANAVILDLARIKPHSREELRDVEGMRRWRTELLGDELVEAIRGP